MRNLNFLALVLCLCVASISFGQKVPKYEKVTKSELLKTTYTIDSTADAVYLRSSYNAYFFANSGNFPVLFTELGKRIKVLTEEGKDLATGSFLVYSYHKNPEDVASFKAVAYNLEGNKVKKTKLGRSDLVKERLNNYTTKYSYTIPDVRKGTIIDVHVKLENTNIAGMHNHYFQKDYPVLRSDFCLSFPSSFGFSMDMRGLRYPEGGRSYGTDNNIILHYYMNDVDAYEEERFISSEKNYRSEITPILMGMDANYRYTQFLMTNWKELAEFLDKDDDFGYRLKGNKFLQAEATALTEKGLEKEALMQAAYQRVCDQLKWNDELEFFTFRPLSKAWNEGAGTSAEINMTLVELLRQCGFKAYPLAISTVSNGRVNPHIPSYKQFNTMAVIAYLDGKRYVMDASAPEVPFGTLPAYCENGAAYIIEKTNCTAFEVGSWGVESVSYMENLKIDPESNKLVGQINMTLKDYAAASFRRRVKELGREEALGRYFNREDLEATDLQITDDPKNKRLVKLKFNVKSVEELDPASTTIRIPGVINANFLKKEDRKVPVYFGQSWERNIVMQLEIPQDVTEVILPEKGLMKYNGNEASMLLSAQQAGNRIILQMKLKVHKPIVSVEEYKGFRDFMRNAVQSMNQEIILMR